MTSASPGWRRNLPLSAARCLRHENRRQALLPTVLPRVYTRDRRGDSGSVRGEVRPQANGDRPQSLHRLRHTGRSGVRQAVGGDEEDTSEAEGNRQGICNPFAGVGKTGPRSGGDEMKAKIPTPREVYDRITKSETLTAVLAGFLGGLFAGGVF